MKRDTKTELILSTYNNPRSLELCLMSVARQSFMPSTICIADDGSGLATQDLIAQAQDLFPHAPLRHVWHDDQGFQKCKILNDAIRTSDAEFLFFIDGDVLIHPDFLARHFALAKRGRFSTGSLIRLDDKTTKEMTDETVNSGLFHDRDWLRQVGAVDRFGTWLKTMPLPFALLNIAEILTPVRKALCGANWSAFRSDILRVNGFDENMTYGGLDKELGIRFENAGIRGRHLRYTAPLIHLDHPRGYRDPEKIKQHRKQIKTARQSNVFWTENGIEKQT